MKSLALLVPLVLAGCASMSKPVPPAAPPQVLWLPKPIDVVQDSTGHCFTLSMGLKTDGVVTWKSEPAACPVVPAPAPKKAKK